MKFKKNGGFTLVELIVVIAILAILAGVAVPAYSGYIAKANEAADLQLVSAANTAFSAACMEKNVDHRDLVGTQINLDSEGKIASMQYNGITLSETPDYASLGLFTAFKNYYGANIDTPFKVFIQLYYAEDGWTGVKEGDELVQVRTDKGTVVTLKKDDAAKFVESVYGTDMETAEVLGKVDLVTGVAEQMLVDGNGTLAGLFASENYTNALAAAMGVDPSDEDAYVNASLELVRKAAKAKDPTLTDEYLMSDAFIGSDAFNSAQASVLSNNAVLFAAQNTAAASDGILDLLKGTNAKGDIAKNLVNAETNDVGMAQAAIAYGLYTAYAERNGKDVPEDPTDVMSLLDNDAAFKAYLETENAQTDLAGYVAAMNMINDNTGNNELVQDVLINGFNTADLNDLLSGAKDQAK